MAPRSIIIDTDPGQDDCLAILLALASPELEILGLTAVAGNVGVELTARNALRICAIAGRGDVKVFRGADRPLLRPLRTAPEIHGRTGLDGADLPEPRAALQPEHAVDWLVRTLMRRPDRGTTLVAIGPLTNVALALRREPAIVGKLEEIVIMGGASRAGGNVTPAAEFNIHVDPHAAAVVLGCGAPIALMPLDVTHHVLATPARRDRIRAIGTPAAATVTQLLDFYAEREKIAAAGVPLHDPCTIAYLVDPTLFRGERIHVAVELAGEHTQGMTVMDWRRRTGQTPNCFVFREADDERFFALLTERLGRL
jgi:purine nucleosidase